MGLIFRLHHLYRAYFVMAVALMLSGCGDTWFGTSKPPHPGERVAIIQSENTLALEEKTTTKTVTLPPPAIFSQWPQAGGNTQHAPGHVSLAEKPREIWKRNIGTGASKYVPLISGPVSADGLVFSLDARGHVSALSLADGQKKWKTSIIPEKVPGECIGGGVAFDEGRLYVSSPFAEILCLKADTGDILWRKPLRSPARISPTVADGYVVVLTITNELEVFDGDSGDFLWGHSGIAEAASILGGASPAIDQGAVIVAYSSGELFALKLENGHELWSEGLASRFQRDAISSLPHIRARPVISDGVVYAISHGGRMAAIDIRTGERLWEKAVSGLHTPAVASDYIFFISSEAQITCLEKTTGLPVWVKNLNALHTAEGASTNGDKRDLVQWAGPVLAGNYLIITGSNGEICFLSPQDGHLQHHVKVSSGIPVSPIVVDNTVIVLTESADLVAFR